MADGFFTGANGLLSDAFNKVNWDKVGDFGFGLLANSGPSLQPHSFASSLGAAGNYMNEREGERAINDMRRQQIAQSKQELEGQQQLAEYIKAGGQVDLPTLLRFMPTDTAKGIAAAYADPTLSARQETVNAALPGVKAESELKSGELATAKSEITNLIQSTTKASDAADYLKSLPGGEQLGTMDDETLKKLRKAKANNWDQSLLGDLAERFLTKIPRDQWSNALDAAEQMQKARSAITTLSNTANRAGAFGLEQKLTAQAEGAGLNLQSDVFHMALDKAKNQAAGYSDFKLPELDPKQFSWRQGVAPKVVVSPPGSGVQNGKIVPQPAPVYGDLPPGYGMLSPNAPPAPPAAAAPPPAAPPVPVPSPVPMVQSPPLGAPPAAAAPAPAAPAVRKVPTQTLDPVTGAPMITLPGGAPFPRQSDAQRATPPGQKSLFLGADGKVHVWGG